MSVIHPTARIHSTAIIYDRVKIGANTYIGPYCVIGSPPEHSQINTSIRDSFVKHGWVDIGDECIIHKHVTIDAAVIETNCTYIEHGCQLYAHSHVGHDAAIRAKCVISSGAMIGGHAIIGMYSTIGLNATVHQHSEMAQGTMLGASSFFKGINDNPYRIYAGVPSKYIGDNKVLMERMKFKK